MLAGQREPGLRADYGTNCYAAFVADPDGDRIEAYCSNETPPDRLKRAGPLLAKPGV
jgi:hypothetical protein